MSIIARSWNLFLKSRVISYGLQVDRMMVELCKNGFENPEETFLDEDPMSYYECRYYSYFAKRFRPSSQYLSKYEAQQYDEAVEKFKKFDDLYHFVQQLSRLYWEQKTLYLDIIREISSHNFWNRSESASLTYLHQLEVAIQNYHNFLKTLEEYPEWKEKVTDEIGYFQHMIYTTLQVNERGKEIFNKFVISNNRHYYFK